jgi:hypothetical protein
MTAITHNGAHAFKATPHGSGHPSHHPHGHPKRHGQPRHEKHTGRWVALATLAIIVGGALALTFANQSTKHDPVTALAEQMTMASDGLSEPTRHAFGGRLYTKRDGDQVIVVANGLPQKECVQLGWALMKRGVLTVNGVTPQRISAAILADLCAKADDGSKLEWAPKTAEEVR